MWKGEPQIVPCATQPGSGQGGGGLTGSLEENSKDRVWDERFIPGVFWKVLTLCCWLRAHVPGEGRAAARSHGPPPEGL